MIDYVMCVDDDTMTLTLNRITLQRSEFCQQVLLLDSGHAALEELQKLAAADATTRFFPTIIFLDLNMPMVDGWEFLDLYQEQFAARFPATRIIILSSSVDPKDRERSKKYPVVLEFVSKPLRLEVIGELKRLPALRNFFPTPN